MYVYAPYACLVSKEVRRGHEFPGTGVIDGCEPPCGCIDLNLGLLQEQSVLETTELPFQLKKAECFAA